MCHRKRPEGVSLVIATIFISILLYAVGDLALQQLKTLESIRNGRANLQTMNYAEGALATARLWAGRHGEGANVKSVDIAQGDPNYHLFVGSLIDGAADFLGGKLCVPAGGGEPCVGFEVMGQATAPVKLADFSGQDIEYWSVPAAVAGGSRVHGSGNAASDCEQRNTADANDPCHWNRMKVGETVQIPLFTLNAGGTVAPHNWATSPNNAEFYVRVRAPCSPSEAAPHEFPQRCDVENDNNGHGGRVKLYPEPGLNYSGADYRNVKKDPVLIQWSISDAEDAGAGSLLAGDAATGSGNAQKRDVEPKNKTNTEISAGRINMARSATTIPTGLDTDTLKEFKVLRYTSDTNAQDKGEELTGHPTEVGNYISWPMQSGLKKPLLRLNFVARPKRDLHDMQPGIDLPTSQKDKRLNLPYLEYQVLSREIRISDSKSFLRAWASFGGIRKEVRAIYRRRNSEGGFVLSNL